MRGVRFSWWKSVFAIGLMCAATAIAAPAQIFTSLVSFNGTDGAQPYSKALVQGTDGNLYGTTFIGGANDDGTVFKVTPTGTLTTLHSFNFTDGDGPQAGLVLGVDGNLYGATSAGGANNDGTVFKITPGGTLTTLHSFDYTDGTNPDATLVQATDGNFYGTTIFGADNSCPDGCGTVFKISPAGTFTTLHSFDSTDGANPYGALVQATDGNFYGTTTSGGANNDGTIFKMTPGGTLTTLHSFDGTDGANPFAGLVQATDGNFYGTTYGGGINCGVTGCGTVFKITPGGTLITLHRFDSTDGANPYGALAQATDGNFYGATYGGGADYGTVFKITAGGTLTTLHRFHLTDGAAANAVVQATNGGLFGTTFEGGDSGDGTVLSLAIGLGPFVQTLPTSGNVGAGVIILGTNLTGATSVSFNGTAATFTVVSRSEITTTVPVGATTGKVQVTTPSRTLSSNVPFRVR